MLPCTTCLQAQRYLTDATKHNTNVVANVWKMDTPTAADVTQGAQHLLNNKLGNTAEMGFDAQAECNERGIRGNARILQSMHRQLRERAGAAGAAKAEAKYL